VSEKKWMWAAILGLLLSVAAAAADLSGTWRGIYTSADGRHHRITFDLKVEGAKVTGTVAGTVNKTSLLDGKASKDEVDFWAQWPYGKFHYVGKLRGDAIQFTVQAGEYKSEMTASRVSN